MERPCPHFKWIETGQMRIENTSASRVVRGVAAVWGNCHRVSACLDGAGAGRIGKLPSGCGLWSKSLKMQLTEEGLSTLSQPSGRSKTAQAGGPEHQRFTSPRSGGWTSQVGVRAGWFPLSLPPRRLATSSCGLSSVHTHRWRLWCLSLLCL